MLKCFQPTQVPTGVIKSFFKGTKMYLIILTDWRDASKTVGTRP